MIIRTFLGQEFCNDILSERSSTSYESRESRVKKVRFPEKAHVFRPTAESCNATKGDSNFPQNNSLNMSTKADIKIADTQIAIKQYLIDQSFHRTQSNSPFFARRCSEKAKALAGSFLKEKEKQPFIEKLTLLDKQLLCTRPQKQRGLLETDISRITQEMMNSQILSEERSGETPQERSSSPRPRFLELASELKVVQAEEKLNLRARLSARTDDPPTQQSINRVLTSARSLQKVLVKCERKENEWEYQEQSRSRILSFKKSQREEVQVYPTVNTEFNVLMNEKYQQISDSNQRKLCRIYELPVNKSRRVVWKNHGVDQFVSSCSPLRSRPNSKEPQLKWQ